MNFFFFSSIGHFPPASSGQFEAAKPGQLKTAKGGLLNRRIQKSERVAILDIHLLRAGQLMGLFESTEQVSLHYFSMEDKYLRFCKALDVFPSLIDEIMWSFMKRSNTLALRALTYHRKICT